MATPDLSEFRQPAKAPVCKIATLLAELDKKRSAQLAAALIDPSIYGTSIQAVLGGWGPPVSDPPISVHRRGRCHCGRNA